MEDKYLAFASAIFAVCVFGIVVGLLFQRIAKHPSNFIKSSPPSDSVIGNVRDAGTGMQVSVDPNLFWLYPEKHPPPRGSKIYLLTRGGVSVDGTWSDDGRFIAWRHLFKRDKEQEQEP